MFQFLIHLILVSFFFVSQIHASIQTKERFWYGMFAKKKLTEKSSLFNEAQLRYDLNTPTMQQTIFRFGGLYQLDLNHEFGILGGYVQTGLIKEYRPTFQYTYFSDSNKKFPFTLRNRLEARFLEDQEETSLRYRVMIRTQKKFNEKVYFAIWDEPFVNLTTEDWTGEKTFERNRFFIGPRFSFDQLQIEIGYLNQYIPRKEKDTIEHIIVTYLFF